MASPTRSAGLFKSLDTLPLFDSNGPVRRSHQRGLDWINSIPPLYLAIACLILFITTFGLISSLSSAAGEADRLRQTLAEVNAALGVDNETLANTTSTVADVQGQLAKQKARFDTILSENAELEHAYDVLGGQNSQLAAQVKELKKSQSDCGEQIKTLVDGIKTHIKTQMSEEQKSILNFINNEEGKLLEDNTQAGGGHEAATPAAEAAPAEDDATPTPAPEEAASPIPSSTPEDQDS